MAPIKFEENMKEKLEKRTIKPSVDSWSKLSNRLDAENKRKIPYWRLGIAASIIGVLFINTHFFIDNSKQEHIKNVVVKPEIKNNKPKDILVQGNKTNENKIDVKKAIKSNSLARVIDSVLLIKEKKETTYNIAKQDLKKQLKKENIEKNSTVILNTLTFEEQKIQEVAAQINELDNTESIITDETIEALLLKAQREIALEKLHNDSINVVDAKLLLEDVEQDLEESFRKRVFEALKTNYNKVKTVIAQRNN